MLYQEIQYRLHFEHKLILLTFLWVSKDCFNKNVYNFGYVSKVAILGLFKIEVFWNKDYEVTISAHDVTYKILSRDSNHIVDVVGWPKFGNSNISMREVIIISYL